MGILSVLKGLYLVIFACSWVLHVIAVVETKNEGNVQYNLIRDTRLCNNGDVKHDRMCKLATYFSNGYSGKDIACDQRRIVPEDCREAVIVMESFSRSELERRLPALDDDTTIRSIRILTTNHDQDIVKSIGEEIDYFLAHRLWWYVVEEPYRWKQQQELRHRRIDVNGGTASRKGSEGTSRSASSSGSAGYTIVFHRSQHQFEPLLRFISSTQYPSEEFCAASPLLLNRKDVIHPGWLSTLTRYAFMKAELSSAVVAFYLSRNNNAVDDSFSFIDGRDCPHKINKWACAFLPTTNCSLPRQITDCHLSQQHQQNHREQQERENAMSAQQRKRLELQGEGGSAGWLRDGALKGCVNEYPDTRWSSALFNASTATAHYVPYRSAEYTHIIAAAEANKVSQRHANDNMRSVVLNAYPRVDAFIVPNNRTTSVDQLSSSTSTTITTTTTRDPMSVSSFVPSSPHMKLLVPLDASVAPMQKEFHSALDIFTQSLVLRPAYLYRSRIHQAIDRVLQQQQQQQQQQPSPSPPSLPSNSSTTTPSAPPPFTLRARCIAAQIRRGDRAVRARNITDFCLHDTHTSDFRKNELGCFGTPFASVKLRHVLDGAMALAQNSSHHVRTLVVATDDEEWLQQEQRELRRMAHTDPVRYQPYLNWRVISLPPPSTTTTTTSSAAASTSTSSTATPPAGESLPEVHVGNAIVRLAAARVKDTTSMAGVPSKAQQYHTMRSGGTSSGVLLFASLALMRQCEGFVGHFESGLTLLAYQYLCAQHRHYERVCPPAFDVRNIPEIKIDHPKMRPRKGKTPQPIIYRRKSDE